MQIDGKLSTLIRGLEEAGYRVSRRGVVTLPSGKVARIRYNADGYPCFTAGDRCSRMPVMIHKWLAYLKFGEACFDDSVQVRHLDGNCTNSTWDNLALGTPHDNIMDRPEAERVAHAKKAARVQRRLTEEQVRALRQDRSRGLTYKDLTTKYGLSKASISYLLNGRLYRDV